MVLVLLAALALAGHALAAFHPGNLATLLERQVPEQPIGVKTIQSPNGVSIRYKEPGKDGVCETTTGVNSYSGYVDLDNNTHMFFWFFEARNNPNKAPITLWINGGPGADSFTGLFEELGPCIVTENLTTELNPYSWSEASNLLFLSQPIGVGFSYDQEISSTDPTGRWPYVDPYRTDTTRLAAVGVWEVLQAFIETLPSLDANIESRSFSLWTESYGGHWGPTFFRYFYEQNQAIEAGKIPGMPYFPEFAVHNTYGLELINETIYNMMKINYYFPGGCRDYIDYCALSDLTDLDGLSTCAQAAAICRSLVQRPFSVVTNVSTFDIRALRRAEIPPTYWYDYVNLESTQNSLGVDLNYTNPSNAIAYGFDYTGDHVYMHIMEDLEAILDYGVQIALVYGDADYSCNWFGGEAVSLEANYKNSAEFRSAGYAPFVVDGKEYGATRQYGNFSFTRVYDSGHEVPYYQPEASLELFCRVLSHLAIADGSEPVTPTYKTNGTAESTHTESYSGHFTGRP
ncbi:alpha/beta-hydrolase [Thozetella sp. PMI_491]|nr:alpha/beta-hydrolase [Thozetella sp. PMI_491]